MEEIIDLIATDSSSSDITGKIKDVLFAKSASKVESQKQPVANVMFTEPQDEVEPTTPTEEPE